MNSFIISARKYRPQTFEQIQGQEHITTTLKNALTTQQLAQVFLFCGPKGTGKTTCARVLAKAINCQKLSKTGEPCEACTSCQNIRVHRSINIHELDAASHNSVEDIRNLVEQVRYRPPTGKKIFIIDEAHMLSNAAFHGLLKILEEPPSYVIFIFATTEKNKVLDTIISRCQIFEFHYLPTPEITKQLQHIAQKECIAYEQEALELISHKAEGSLRDAFSTFDLVTNFEANKKITYKATLRHLNLLDHTYYFKLTEALAERRTAEVLLLYDEIVRMSFRGDHFITGLSEHLRNTLTTALTDRLPLLNPTITHPEAYYQQTKKLSKEFLHHALQLTHHYSLHYRYAQNKRLHIELLLLQIIQHAPNPPDHSSNKGKEQRAISMSPTPHHTTTLQSQTRSHTPATARQKSQPTPHHHHTPPSLEQSQPPKPNRASTKEQTLPRSGSSTNPLTKEFILSHWEAYAKNIEHTDPAGFSIMNLPIKVSANTITLCLVHPSQQEKLTRLKPGLNSYLQQKTGHNNLFIKTTLLPYEDQPKPYTQAEHLSHLIKKNKSVAILQKKLGLELL